MCYIIFLFCPCFIFLTLYKPCPFFFFLMIRRPPRSTLFPHDALPISHGVFSEPQPLADSSRNHGDFRRRPHTLGTPANARQPSCVCGSSAEILCRNEGSQGRPRAERRAWRSIVIQERECGACLGSSRPRTSPEKATGHLIRP